MTVWHFGTGDVEATRELQDLSPVTGFVRIGYALALGSAPVLLPLTSPAAIATLTAIEPQLATLMSEQVIVGTRIAVLTLVVLCLLWLIQRGDLRGAVELFALAALGFVASPLVAFAVYFGFWHALRHTARLAQVTYGTINWRSLALVSRGGLPSVVGFLAIVVLSVAFVDPSLAMGPALWFGLAIVWGLTVPHMIMVARFDARMRSQRS
jgi:Brp/Blh family beta-carotene 15,15'-monooxygenase